MIKFEQTLSKISVHTPNLPCNQMQELALRLLFNSQKEIPFPQEALRANSVSSREDMVPTAKAYCESLHVGSRFIGRLAENMDQATSLFVFSLRQRNLFSSIA